jgi:AraC family ethanolamine operon transcriptional activator
VLSTRRCTDPAAVAGLLPGTRRRLLPLAGDFDFFQTELRVGSLRLVIVKRPPCASEGFLDPGQIGVAFAMKDSHGLKLDGCSLEPPAIVTHGLSIPHRIFQPSDLTIAALFMPASNGDRGWPGRDQAARVEFIQAKALQQMRSVVLDVLNVAWRDPKRFLQDSVLAGIRESLFGSVDHAYMTAPGEAAPSLAIGNHIRICRRAEEFIRCRAPDLPGSAEVAAAAGVTIRTLHNAMVAVRGMNLQRFMILSRLWSARAALLRGGSTDLVKTIAFDHGFWHMGRFSRTYRAFFGEAPSDTLARARAN